MYVDGLLFDGIIVYWLAISSIFMTFAIFLRHCLLCLYEGAAILLSTFLLNEKDLQQRKPFDEKGKKMFD